MKAKIQKLQILPLEDDSVAYWMRNLYENSFPAEERRPWDDLLEKCNKQQIEAYGLYCGDVPCGFATVWRFPEFAYVEHLAIDADRRGRGLGSKVLELLKAAVGDLPIVLEVEHPETDQARRRIRYYENNGFTLRSEFEYMQPPYGRNLPWVPLFLMTFPNKRQCPDLKHVVACIHKEVYNLK